jgi:hypothetical protein
MAAWVGSASGVEVRWGAGKFAFSELLARGVLERWGKIERKWTKFLVDAELMHTFASPFEKWDLAYVSTNQNQITVIRSQSGG